MSEPVPLLIEAAECSPFGEARIVVEVTGRWVDHPPVPATDSALLIVEAGGLVHRFPEISGAPADAHAGDEYRASFVVSAQFRRRIESPTALRTGGFTATVPGAVGVGFLDSRLVGAVASRGGDPVIAALREEISQRVAEETRLRGELSQLRSQLEARARNSGRLEEVQGELRTAVAKLTERVHSADGHMIALESSNAALETANASLSSEVASLRQALAQARAELEHLTAACDAAAAELNERHAELVVTKVSHETALEEVDELRRELERGGAELAEARERSVADEVQEAESLLAETRALTSRLIGRSGESDGPDD